MFKPPRCPNPVCPAHHIETLTPSEWGLQRSAEFYRTAGYYWPKCRSVPVPRFKCRICNRGFSRQTFRADYCDNKPHLNAKLFDLLASGVGLRQSGRMLKLSRRCTEEKARKVSRHLGRIVRRCLAKDPELRYQSARDVLIELKALKTETDKRGSGA